MPSRRVSVFLIAAQFFIVSVQANHSYANEEQRYFSKICDQAAGRASRETGVPLDILKAIARTESGITKNGAFGPWPWTVNVEGRGIHLDSERDALNYIVGHHSRGATNIDIGCFQINHRWHGAQFSSFREIIDPVSNAQYAAEFLKNLYAEFGNWQSAIGAYHSRNAELSRQYMARLKPILKELRNAPVRLASDSTNVIEQNAFPLLQGTARARTGGSLFPETTASRGSLLMRSGTRG
ncbi:transglycosylase SLT domain-containing protein [Roseobacter weihaiensis]|uniref:transglycosylase SLT domain-containing protein n=1 Tax=Roseobacter weihaiensis TaxID=2763262 RepID=UPI001D0B029E|nr:transglycosylase SLT domain-containing protein [Roseobacter sp. H9]